MSPAKQRVFFFTGRLIRPGRLHFFSTTDFTFVPFLSYLLVIYDIHKSFTILTFRIDLSMYELNSFFQNFQDKTRLTTRGAVGRMKSMKLARLQQLKTLHAHRTFATFSHTIPSFSSCDLPISP